MLQPATRCRAAVPLAASDPIQASEAKAPLAESRGVCMALWTRMGFDVSEAVPLTAPSIPAAQTVKTRSMCGLLDWARSSRGPRRLSTSASGLGSAPGQTWAHCPPFVAAGRWGIEVRLDRRNHACCCGGLPGLPVQLVPARSRLAGARPDSGGLWPLGMALGQAARRAQDGGASRCQFGPAPTRLSGRLVRVDEAREYRLNNRERMELIEAVQEGDVETVFFCVRNPRGAHAHARARKARTRLHEPTQRCHGAGGGAGGQEEGRGPFLVAHCLAHACLCHRLCLHSQIRWVPHVVCCMPSVA